MSRRPSPPEHGGSPGWPPETTHTLHAFLEPICAELDGDDTLLARIAHVHGLIALAEGKPHRAAFSCEHAATLIPDDSGNGPDRTVLVADLAIARCATDPRAAHHAARAALVRPGRPDSAWSTVHARCAMALSDHHNGRTARAFRWVHRMLAEPDLPTWNPSAHEALQAL